MGTSFRRAVHRAIDRPETADLVLTKLLPGKRGSVKWVALRELKERDTASR